MAKNLEKEFVTYEQAVVLKELGFKEECMANCMGYGKGEIENGTYKIEHTQIFYPNDWITSDDVAENLNLHCFHMCKIPLKQQVFRWFRKKYGLYSIIHCPIRNRACFTITGFDIVRATYSDTLHISYEEAENACIDRLIELVKQDKNERTI
jgi:hypothetical protein